MDIPIIDAHHHVWQLNRTPWLQGPPVPRIFGEYSALRRDYLMSEFAADVRPCGVVDSVYVQVNVAQGDEVNEAAWVTAESKTAGFGGAITGFADLSSPSVGDVLDAQLAISRLRGVRQQLHWHDNPAYRFAAAPDVMLRRDWQAGLRQVMHRRLLFELQVFPSQYRHALELIDQFPHQIFVLLHAGMLEDQSAEGLNLWRSGLEQFAKRANVFVKLSGLGTFRRECRLESWKPVIQQTVDLFGPSRCLFGSNFPIEKLWTSYDNLIKVIHGCLAEYDSDERRLILHDVAKNLYRL